MIKLSPNDLGAKHYIDGKSVRGEGEALAVLNPGTEEVVAEFAGASEQQIAQAIKAARRAFDKGAWRDLPAIERAAALKKMLAYLGSQQERLIELTVAEAGCPRNSPVMFGQVHSPLKSGADILDLYQKLPEFEENPLPAAERITLRGGVLQSLRFHRPLGVVSAISAYNFPFYTNLWKVIPALITGNSVVLRPNPFTPLAALIFGEAAEAAGLPPGVLNVVAEKSLQGGVTMTTDPDVDMVAFTGSSKVGQQVMSQAAPTLKRLQLELGGKSAQIYLQDSCDLSVTAPRTIFLNHAGQGCVLGTRIMVPQSEKSRLLAAMTAALAGTKIGDPDDPATNMGPVISAAQRDRCEQYVRAAVQSGARVVAGGKRPEHLAKGFFFEPTILDVPDNRNPAAQDEIFGPVVCVIGYRDEEHAIEMANDTPFGLSGYVFGADLKKAAAIAARMRTGTVQVNGSAFSSYASSGGWRESGLGRERGVEGIRIYQQIQCINLQEAAK